MKALVVANWKMNPRTFKEARKLFEATRKAAESLAGVSVIVAPPTIFLRDLAASYRGKRISFAAQNAHFEADGARTGEISAPQVRDARASYLLVGHAERRAEGETNEDTRKKVASALGAKLVPILCVGEQRRTRDGEHYEIVRAQLREGLAEAGPKLKNVIIAYEPLWTIGGSSTMSPRDMHEMSIFIRKTIVELHDERGLSTRILYGGSVDGENAPAMLKLGEVKGFLVGRASLSEARITALLYSIGNAV